MTIETDVHHFGRYGGVDQSPSPAQSVWSRPDRCPRYPPKLRLTPSVASRREAFEDSKLYQQVPNKFDCNMSRHAPAADNNVSEASHGFLAESMAASAFEEYLADADTDTENSTLPPTRRWVWYCKLKTCPKYYAAWSCKTNFLLHLFETPVHREDSSTTTREGRRQLALAWREETAYDLSEPKKQPPVNDTE